MSLRDRLKKQEKRLTGGVTLADDGKPVIFVEGQGYQFNGLFHERLQDLDRGVYQVLSGPEVEFGLFWDEGRTWPAAIEIMKERGAEYRPISE